MSNNVYLEKLFAGKRNMHMLHKSEDGSLAWGEANGRFAYWRVLPRECIDEFLLCSARDYAKPGCLSFAMYCDPESKRYIAMVIPGECGYSASRYIPHGCGVIGVVSLTDDVFSDNAVIRMISHIFVPFVDMGDTMVPVTWSIPVYTEYSIDSKVTFYDDRLIDRVTGRGIENEVYDLFDDNILQEKYVETLSERIGEDINDIMPTRCGSGYCVIRVSHDDWVFAFMVPKQMYTGNMPCSACIAPVILRMLAEYKDTVFESNYISYLAGSKVPEGIHVRMVTGEEKKQAEERLNKAISDMFRMRK